MKGVYRPYMQVVYEPELRSGAISNGKRLLAPKSLIGIKGQEQLMGIAVEGSIDQCITRLFGQ